MEISTALALRLAAAAGVSCGLLGEAVPYSPSSCSLM